MNILGKHPTFKILLISLISALFILYPNITWMPWELSLLDGAQKTHYLLIFAFRCIFYTAFIFLLIKINLQRIKTLSFVKRFWQNALISTAAFAIYGAIFFLIDTKVRHFGSIVLFQFFVAGVLCTLMGLL